MESIDLKIDKMIGKMAGMPKNTKSSAYLTQKKFSKDLLNMFIKDIRTPIADYMAAEGCSCCRNVKKHAEAQEMIAKMLKIKKYKDGSGYDFYKHRTQK